MNVFSLAKKHSTVLAILAVLAGCLAAPYMIPENPDATVFRSGVLGALLLAGCFFPVREALERCSRRELGCGLVLGLLFAFALSLGSELFVYNGLLRGLGSAIRRAAVPVLATPLLGCLSARLMLLRSAPSARMSHMPHMSHMQRIPMPAFALLFLLCWLPVLLAYFPGMLNYDIVDEYNQLRLHQYYAINPLLYSLVELSLLRLGAAVHSATFGLFLCTAARMLCLAFALAYGCSFAQKRHINPFVLFLITAFFALHPVFSVLSVSTNKDVPFAAALLTLSLLSWDLLEAPDAFLSDKKRCLLFVVMVIGTSSMRKNGVFALLLLLPGLVIALRGRRLRALCLCGGAAVCCALLELLLTLCLSPVPQPVSQLYSLPAQQLVRAYNNGTMSEADATELESWYLYPTGLNIYEHIADRAKINLDQDRLAEDDSAFWDLWMRNARSNLHEYTEAFLLLNMGLWYPDDLSHSTVYTPIVYDPPGYLETDLNAGELPEFETVCLLPRVRELIERICKQNAYQKYPVVSILFCTATPLWVLAFAAALLAARRRTWALPALLGMLGVWLSYFLGPCTLPRYVLPLFCLAPIALAVAFSSDVPEKRVTHESL